MMLREFHAPALPACGCWRVAPDQGFRALVAVPLHAVLEAGGEDDEVLDVKRLYGPLLGPAGDGGDHAWEQGDRVKFWLQ